MTYFFWIRRVFGGPIEKIKVTARDTWEASDMLPPCVYWDFAS